jgi:glycine oxidase
MQVRDSDTMKASMITKEVGPNRHSKLDPAADIVIVGAGLIGLTIALELHDRGAVVTVVERGQSLAGASTAAAGMLAADDPHNAPELRPLSQLSLQHYPNFLRRIEELCGIAVPFHTESTLQYLPDGTTMCLRERSIDPRQLAAGLLAAVKMTSIRVLDHTRIAAIHETTHGMRIQTMGGAEITAKAIVYATGAWTNEVMTTLSGDAVPIAPRKGQMLRVRLPGALSLREVHRSERIYIVPRTCGPQAGTALIGATVEDAGFDTTVRAKDLARLRALAAELLPELAAETETPMVEAWAGLRPATPDFLPILGACSRMGHFVASGHYRNGILHAPATAIVIADLVEGKEPSINISAFSIDRLSTAQRSAGGSTAHAGRYSSVMQ